MRITFFALTFPSPRECDGQAMIAYHILKELSAHHDVRLVCFREPHDGQVGDLRLSSVRTVEQPKRKFLWHYLTGAHRKRPWFFERYRSGPFLSEIQQADADPTVDCIILHTPFLAEYLGAIRTKPAVVIGIDALSSWFSQVTRLERQPLKRWHLHNEARAAAWVEQALYPKARAVIVVSEADRQAICANGPSANAFAIPNGVDAQYFQPDSREPEQKTLVFTGMMNYPPNVEAIRWFARDIWPAVLSVEPQAHALMVGRNPTSELVDLGEQVPNFTVTGELPDLRRQRLGSIMNMRKPRRNSLIRFCGCLPIKKNEYGFLKTPARLRNDIPGVRRRRCIEQS
ncbi:MAG: Glycosyltransferase [Candidatus Uhrbacteria bacterium GW2011_GWA2_52_8d]|uniref:Glycosyltransferase n=1 Tax=Candidatus Uhrbacteria bacterium GW2011_GWA2_52_8d TaxID=1618979 RepID=A0A0G2AHU2_9BACT|nr:MAG: Glycosyltransferase [Candidatus Uhrbacteria bacterium GW2011_GWA2_52_8d]